MSLPGNKTKIVATIGPASESRAVIEQMIGAGMNVARLNFSHGDFAWHQRVIGNIRSASESTGVAVAILADLSGPKMRIGGFSTDAIQLQRGDTFTLTTDEIVGDTHRVSINFVDLPRVVHPGDALFLNDGYVHLKVVATHGNDVECTVIAGGELRSRKGLNLPGIKLGIPAFTARDRECLAFALEHGVDAVSQSFVESAADVEAVRRAARALGHQPFLIAKIERSRALECLDEILDAADGVMIARGDLGVEVPIETIAVVQKDIMRRANQRAKPVITATQMLESMTTHRIPTRAEATDVANAILDGTDCVMLSGESAAGNHPIEAVAMLAKIAAAVEPTQRRLALRDLYHGIDPGQLSDPESLIAASVEACFEHALPVAVFAPTRSGTSARRMAALRLPVWIVAVCFEKRTCQDLLFSYGVTAVHEPREVDEWKDYVRGWSTRNGVAGNLAVVTTGPSVQHPDASHRIELIEISAGKTQFEDGRS